VQATNRPRQEEKKMLVKIANYYYGGLTREDFCNLHEWHEVDEELHIADIVIQDVERIDKDVDGVSLIFYTGDYIELNGRDFHYLEIQLV
jgi:hypothetical protein